MANKIGWGCVRAELADVQTALAATPASEQTPDTIVARSQGEWVVLHWEGWGFAEIHSVVNQASTAGPGLSVFVFDFTWNVQVHLEGSVIAERQDYGVPTPVLRGDPDRAESVLGLRPGLLRQTHIGDPLGDVEQDDLGSMREQFLMGILQALEPAVTVDGHDLSDEWGFLVLLDALGIDFYEPGEHRWRVEPEAAPQEPLPVVEVFDPARFRRQHLTAWQNARVETSSLTGAIARLLRDRGR